jgi:hypothetical protein
MNRMMFQQRVVEALSSHTEALIHVLRQLVRHPYPPEVVHLAFEVFTDGFRSGFPVRVFFIDAENNEFFLYEDGEAKYPSSVDPGLLDIPSVYGEELEKELEEDDPEADFYTLAGEALVPWFSDCWQAAGGAGFSRAASIRLHDDVKFFDLIARQWRSD